MPRMMLGGFTRQKIITDEIQAATSTSSTINAAGTDNLTLTTTSTATNALDVNVFSGGIDIDAGKQIVVLTLDAAAELDSGLLTMRTGKGGAGTGSNTGGDSGAVFIGSKAGGAGGATDGNGGISGSITFNSGNGGNGGGTAGDGGNTAAFNISSGIAGNGGGDTGTGGTAGDVNIFAGNGGNGGTSGGTAGDGGNLVFTAGSAGSTGTNAGTDGGILFVDIPTSDPSVAGQIFRTGNTLMISTG